MLTTRNFFSVLMFLSPTHFEEKQTYCHNSLFYSNWMIQRNQLWQKCFFFKLHLLILIELYVYNIILLFQISYLSQYFELFFSGPENDLLLDVEYDTICSKYLLSIQMMSCKIVFLINCYILLNISCIQTDSSLLSWLCY